MRRAIISKGLRKLARRVLKRIDSVFDKKNAPLLTTICILLSVFQPIAVEGLEVNPLIPDLAFFLFYIITLTVLFAECIALEEDFQKVSQHREEVSPQAFSMFGKLHFSNQVALFAMSISPAILFLSLTWDRWVI